MKTEAEKKPAKGRRISYGKFVADGITRWQLFRRSEISRRVFCESIAVDAFATRTAIAAELRRMRARLRDAVDAYDLSLLGVSA